MEKKLSKQKTQLANIPTLNDLPELPQSIGPYPVDAFYAKGGMSHLYLATIPETKTPIIIKILPKSYITFPDMVRRFLQEAKIIAKTDHPNIVKLIDQGSWKNGVYIAMEFIRGISLKKIIQKNVFSLEKSLQIILQIATAISHLHAHGIIHRDLKPENILIDENGTAKVIDFGIARMHDEKIDLEKLEGTVLYMSPEQQQKKTVDHRSDIYSLGLIAYELLTGKAAFGMIQIRSLAPSLRALLSKALSIKPEERYSDIIDFIHAIKRTLDSDLSQMMNEPTRMTESLQKAQQELCTFPNRSEFFEIAYSSKNEMKSAFFDYRQINQETIITLFSSLSSSLNQYIYTAHLAGFYKAYIEERSKIDLPHLVKKMDELTRKLKQEFSLTLCHFHSEQPELHLCSMGPSFIYKEFNKPEKLQGEMQPLGVENPANLRIQSIPLWEEQTLQMIHFSSCPCKKTLKKLPAIIESSQPSAFTNRPKNISEDLFSLSSWGQHEPFVFFIRKTL